VSAASRPPIFRGWFVVAVGALVLIVTAGARTAPGAFLLDMTADTGWSIGLLSGAASLGLILFGFGGPIAAALMARLGVRRLTLLSIALTAGSMAVSSLVREAWQLALFFGLVSGLGTGLVASILGATIANRWFVVRRGLVIGLLGASGSAGQLLFFPLLALLADDLGWRTAAVAFACIAAACAVPVLLWLRDDPSDLGLRPLGGSGPVTPPLPPEPGIMRRAVRSPDFWLLAGTFFICGATSNGLIGQHFIAHAADHGFGTLAASTAVAVMGGFNFVGTLVSGWLTDRWDPRRLLLAYYVFRGLSLLYLPLIHDSLDITAFAILFGLDYIATVPPTIALAADTFGRRNVGVVYGWVFASHMLGAALAATGAGIVRDLIGDYGPALVVAGWTAVAAGLAALAIRRRPALVAAPVVVPVDGPTPPVR
jgi:predicted MFS family arabinose efflux permease